MLRNHFFTVCVFVVYKHVIIFFDLAQLNQQNIKAIENVYRCIFYSNFIKFLRVKNLCSDLHRRPFDSDGRMYATLFITSRKMSAVANACLCKCPTFGQHICLLVTMNHGTLLVSFVLIKSSTKKPFTRFSNMQMTLTKTKFNILSIKTYNSNLEQTAKAYFNIYTAVCVHIAS